LTKKIFTVRDLSQCFELFERVGYFAAGLLMYVGPMLFYAKLLSFENTLVSALVGMSLMLTLIFGKKA